MPSATDLAGQPAPGFDLDSTQGRVRLEDLHGRTVVLFFYPRADTPGCTVETCAFRDAWKVFDTAGVALLGISRDTVAAQRRFAAKFEVPFPLLADPDEAVCQAYHVMVDKTMYGKPVRGIARTTFVIDGEGMVARVFPKVQVQGHSEEVLRFVQDGIRRT